MLGGRAVVDAQNPVVLGDLTQPQPDLAVFKYREDFYGDDHPRPEDVLFLVEVADTSLAYDRDSKLPLYALYGIPEVWLVDLNGAVVEVYRRPTADGYAQIMKHEALDAVVASQEVPGVEMTVRTILGR
jgi:Uma2 family endonuclease